VSQIDEDTKKHHSKKVGMINLSEKVHYLYWSCHLAMLLKTEKTRADQKSNPKRNFQGKATASPVYYIQCQLAMVPILKLVGGHKKITSVHISYPYILRS
jgi:hypothetical protein